jgi:dihydroorotate dehydrogenase electron transfer subunit
METRLHRTRGVRTLTGGNHVLEVEGPIPPTRAGQFYMLRTAARWPVLLPRPFSLYDRDAGGAFGSFLLKAIGPGTRALAACLSGDEVWLTGPLGKPFPDEPAPVCVAGGVGVAPFLLLAREQRARGRPPLRLLFGGRDRAALAGLSDFDGLARVQTATDDGSHGFHGLVTALLADLCARGEVQATDTIFCCGPDPMMHAVARFCAGRGQRCLLSLENFMACGYGVCNGCSVRVVPERRNGWPYSRSCQEGPVYDAADLLLD